METQHTDIDEHHEQTEQQVTGEDTALIADGTDPEQRGTDARDTEDSQVTRDDLIDTISDLERMVREQEFRLHALQAAAGPGPAADGTSSPGTFDEGFMRELRESYEKDPVAAIASAVGRARQEAAEEAELLVHRAMEHHRIVKTAIDTLLEHPEAARIRPHRSLIEHLVLERGIDPVEAVSIVAELDGARAEHASRRSAAAREMRNRSHMESSEEAHTPAGPDQDLDRALKSAKNLDEMFANLRRLKV